ncbi:hypothetical protein ACQ4PT_026250 [Festuca glaucescens]
MAHRPRFPSVPHRPRRLVLPLAPSRIARRAGSSGSGSAASPRRVLEPCPRGVYVSMTFMSLKNDIVAVDGERRTVLYDGTSGAIRTIQPVPQYWSHHIISVTAGDGLYVLMAGWPGSPTPYFQALVYGRQLGYCRPEDWHWRPLQPPSFHLPDDYALPFKGRAEYAPEHGLWFGFTDGDERLCAVDLAPTRPPVLRHAWEEDPPRPAEWTPKATRVLPLGSGRLCVARFFWRRKTREKSEYFAVLEGVEVVKDDAGMGSLQMIKHKAKRYGFGEDLVEPL